MAAPPADPLAGFDPNLPFTVTAGIPMADGAEIGRQWRMQLLSAFKNYLSFRQELTRKRIDPLIRTAMPRYNLEIAYCLLQEADTFFHVDTQKDWEECLRVCAAERVDGKEMWRIQGARCSVSHIVPATARSAYSQGGPSARCR